MALYERLKADRIAAMKGGEAQKERKNTLTVFIGDLSTEEKRGTAVDDEFVMRRLKKAVQNAKDNHGITGEDKYLREIEVYNEYLPQQLSEEELGKVVEDIVASLDNPNIGSVMKELKTNYDGQYDGKMASGIVKSKL